MTKRWVEIHQFCRRHSETKSDLSFGFSQNSAGAVFCLVSKVVQAQEQLLISVSWPKIASIQDDKLSKLGKVIVTGIPLEETFS